MRDIVEQIYDELNAQVIRMLEHARKQAERIAELEAEIAELRVSAPVVINYDILYRNASDHKISYNDLCSIVRSATSKIQ